MAVMVLSQRALELATKFRTAIEAEFDRWEHAADVPAGAKSLSLMSEGELECISPASRSPNCSTTSSCIRWRGSTSAWRCCRRRSACSASA